MSENIIGFSILPVNDVLQQSQKRLAYKNSPKFRDRNKYSKPHARTTRERNDTTRLAVSVKTREMVLAIATAIADCEGGRPNVQLTTKQLVADGFERYIEQPRREIAIARMS